LEADGCLWHYCRECGYATPDYQPDALTEHARSSTRDERLRRWFGVLTLHIWGHDLMTDNDAQNVVAQMLAPLLNERNLYYDHD
jgi:hypothetical protein